jgi:hypothetical protein
MDDIPVERNTDEARQGRTGFGVRWVLHIGVALVVIAFAAIWLLH